MKRKHSGCFILFLVMGAVIVLLTAKATPASAATVAKIGSKSYSSLEKAVRAVKKGQTIKLQKNITSDQTIILNKNTTYTLDLNKYKISVRIRNEEVISEPYIYVQKGSVTIKNGTLNTYLQVDKKAKVILSSVKTAKSYAADTWFVVESGGKLTVKSGTYYGNISCYGTVSIRGGKYYGMIYNDGAMTISGGTFTHPSGSSCDDIIFNGSSSAKLTVKGGTFKNYNGSVINLYEGTVKITDGTLKAYGKSSPAVYADSGTIRITGGTIYSKKYYAVYYRKRDCTYSVKNAKVTTGSGKYTSVYASED